jgi:uncharacterized tellurite resistance protein B-like protein
MVELQRIRFLNIVEAATGLDRDVIIQMISEGDVGDLIDEIDDNFTAPKDGDPSYLQNYLQTLGQHVERAEKVDLIHENYEKIEQVFEELRQEVDHAFDESVELEHIAAALDDEELIRKSQVDEQRVEKLNRKLKRLIKIKNEMEEREAALESLTANINVETAVKQRIQLVEALIDAVNSSGGVSGPFVVSISDIHGQYSEAVDMLGMLDEHDSYPDFNLNDYTLVVNGDAFDDRDGGEGRSQDVFDQIKSWASSGNFYYTFGNHDQFILFKELEMMGNRAARYNDPFFETISDSDREWFLRQIFESDGCVVGAVQPLNYTYTHASPVNDFNRKLAEAAEKVHEVVYGSTDITAVITSNPQLQSFVMNNISANDLVSADERKLVAVYEMWLQEEEYPEVFDPNNGAVWVRWADLVSSDPGELVVGHTMASSHGGVGTSLFEDGTNPHVANSGRQINENTIRDDTPTLLVEKSDDVSGLRIDSSGSGARIKERHLGNLT